MNEIRVKMWTEIAREEIMADSIDKDIVGDSKRWKVKYE